MRHNCVCDLEAELMKEVILVPSVSDFGIQRVPSDTLDPIDTAKFHMPSIVTTISPHKTGDPIRFGITGQP